MREVPPFQLVAAPVDERAAELQGFPHAGPEIGSRHRIGGEPSFEVDPPRCSSCSSPMLFYGQLDSIAEGFELADVGVVMVHVCFDCFEASASIHCG